MKAKQNLLLVGIIVIALFLNGCSGASTPTPIPPTATPTPPTTTPIPPTTTPTPPTTTPTPPPDMPKITIADTVFWLTAVVEVEKAAGIIQAKPGYRLLEVCFQADAGTREHIEEITKEFSTVLLDKDGNRYPSVVRGTGVVCPGTGLSLGVYWAFAVPENEKTLWLSLPDGTTIELESYIK